MRRKGSVYTVENGVKELFHTYYDMNTARKYAKIISEEYGVETIVEPYTPPKKEYIPSASSRSVREAISEYLGENYEAF